MSLSLSCRHWAGVVTCPHRPRPHPCPRYSPRCPCHHHFCSHGTGHVLHLVAVIVMGGGGGGGGHLTVLQVYDNETQRAAEFHHCHCHRACMLQSEVMGGGGRWWEVVVSMTIVVAVMWACCGGRQWEVVVVVCGHCRVWVGAAVGGGGGGGSGSCRIVVSLGIPLIVDVVSLWHWPWALC